VVFDARELRDVDVAVDPHAIADDAAVIDGRAVPERAMAADAVLLPDDRMMARFEVVADVDGGVDDRSGPNARAPADPRVAGDAGPPRRVPEENPRVDDGAGAEPDLRRPGHVTLQRPLPAAASRRPS